MFGLLGLAKVRSELQPPEVVLLADLDLHAEFQPGSQPGCGGLQQREAACMVYLLLAAVKLSEEQGNGRM